MDSCPCSNLKSALHRRSLESVPDGCPLRGIGWFFHQNQIEIQLIQPIQNVIEPGRGNLWVGSQIDMTALRFTCFEPTLIRVSEYNHAHTLACLDCLMK